MVRIVDALLRLVKTGNSLYAPNGRKNNVRLQKITTCIYRNISDVRLILHFHKVCRIRTCLLLCNNGLWRLSCTVKYRGFYLLAEIAGLFWLWREKCCILSSMWFGVVAEFTGHLSGGQICVERHVFCLSDCFTLPAPCSCTNKKTFLKERSRAHGYCWWCSWKWPMIGENPEI